MQPFCFFVARRKGTSFGRKRSRGLGTSPQNIKTKIDKLKVFKYIISFFIQLFPAAKSIDNGMENIAVTK